ncbi:hypothetical protein D9M70_497970 [compost metagenome]
MGGHFPIDQVDHTTDGAAPIEQRRGPPEYLDALDQQGFQADRVVGADGGGVEGVDPVAEYPHPGAVQATDDRAAGAGTEAAGAHPRQAVQGFPQGRLAPQGELVALQHPGRAGHLPG